MTKKTKVFIAVGLLLIVILIIVISVIAVTNGANRVKENIEPFLPSTSEEILGDVWEAPPCASIEPTQTFPADTTNSVPSVDDVIREIILAKETKEPMAQITIETDRKTKTFDVMEEVGEKTLKKNIGHLPSSALPNQEGLCVLMGHRDTDLKILKHAKIGDSISVLYNATEYNYSICDIEIIDSNEPLIFDADNGVSLALVTCYPFYYTGSAPRKALFYGKK